MSAAQAQTPVPPTPPGPPGAAPDAPSHIGRVLTLVRKLIGYGRQLAATVQQCAATPAFARFAAPFGTADVTLILRRILNGLRRAAALEAMLSERAARGQDLPPLPIRMPTERGPRPPRQAAPPDAQPASRTEDPLLARLPTAEEIAAEVRRRPVGAVIVDICLDLGIMPGQLDLAFWTEINLAIIRYGGSFVRYLVTLKKRLFDPNPENHADPARPVASPQLPALATGPP